MNHVNENGITCSVPSIIREIANKNDIYFDLLEDGRFLVSDHNKKIGIFTDAEQAIYFYLSKSGIEKTIEEDYSVLQEILFS